MSLSHPGAQQATTGADHPAPELRSTAPLPHNPTPVRRNPALWAGVVLIVLAAFLYAVTLDTGLEPRELDGGDLITHHYAQVQARPGNAPGYPLYTMLGWLWFHSIQPVARLVAGAQPNPVPILSAFSTLWALAALALLYWILCFVTSRRFLGPHARVQSGNWIIAWLITAFFAVTYFFWYYATTTEQYSSATAQTLAILATWLLWLEADARHGPEPYPVRSRPGLLLVLMAFLCGLSLAHMLTVAFIVPPLVIAVLWQRPALTRNFALVGAVIAAAMLPLFSYAFVYIRADQHPEWRGRGEWASTWEWFLYFLSTPQGRDELREGFREYTLFFANGFPELIWQELSLPLLAAGLVGIAFLRRKTAFVLYATLAIYLVFGWAYRYANWYQVVLPAYPLILVGAVVAADRLQHWRPVAKSPFLRALIPTGLAFAIVWRGAASLPAADSRHRPADVDLAHAAVLLESAPVDAALFADVQDTLAIEYLLGIWGLRPDLTTVSSDRAAAYLRAGRPLLATWQAAPMLFSEMRPDARVYVEGLSPDWARIDDTPPVSPTLAPLAEELMPGVTLTGFAASPSPTGSPVSTGAPALDVWLRWNLQDGTWPEGVSLSLRPTLGGELLSAAGNDGSSADDFIHVDAALPLRGLLASQPGDHFVDSFRLPLPAPLPRGADGIDLLLYRATADGFETLAEEQIPLAGALTEHEP